jgi:hypothetical protein
MGMMGTSKSCGLRGGERDERERERERVDVAKEGEGEGEMCIVYQ